MTKSHKNSAVVLATFVLGVGLVYAAVYRPAALRAKQVHNLTPMRTYAQSLQRFHEAHGHFPESLGQAVAEWWPSREKLSSVDTWGNPLVYRRVHDGYLLVCLGMDGKSDGSDYEAMRASDADYNDTCRDYSADQVFSDKREHRTCGK